MKSNNKILAVLFVFIAGILLGAIAVYLLSPKVIPIPDRLYFPELHSVLQNSNSLIHVAMFRSSYYQRDDSKADILLDDLVKAKSRGADVKVILEGGDDYLGEEFLGEQAKTCRYLRGNGVDVRFDPAGTTTHAKLIIADNNVILGSTNWNYYALEKNHEANVLIRSGDISGKFEEYFKKLWMNSKDTDCEIPDTITEKTAQYCSTIRDILSNRDYCSNKDVSLDGIAKNIKFRTSKRGSNYTTFDLVDNGIVSVFSWGKPDISNGESITVQGKFYKERKLGEYTFYDEIEADTIN
jgi:hypothetical protein